MTVLIVVIVLLGLWAYHTHEKRTIAKAKRNIAERKKLVEDLTDSASSLASFIPRHFVIRPCSRCHESALTFLQASPNGRSIQAQCTTCSKKFWFRASSEKGAEIMAHISHRADLLVRL